MNYQFSEHAQYKNDFFNKLNFKFEPNKKLLDLGCGDGSDSSFFIEQFDLDVKSIDIYKHPNINKNSKLKFQLGDIYQIPFDDKSFDYVFLHDVLHHIDEPTQRREKHISGLRELNRIKKDDGIIIIAEGNRYNPLFYPHMVKMLGHDHFKQSYFIDIVSEIFPQTEFKFFESHFYPSKGTIIWKTYEKLMERFSPKQFLAYNIAIIK